MNRNERMTEILGGRLIDHGCELDVEPLRFMLIETSTCGGEAWITTFDSVDLAAAYHDGQEYRPDWDIEALHDLDYGDRFEAVTTTHWRRIGAP